MPEADTVKFLGTAGARFVMAKQIRYSAGTFLRLRDTSIMLDPGPGTLTRCAKAKPKVDPESLDAIIVTHAHIDHSNDLNVLIDAMTRGGWQKQGKVFAPQKCLEGPDRVLLNYVRDFPNKIVSLEPETDYEVGDVQFSTSVRHHHSVDTYGIKFHRQAGALSFLVDTQYFDGLAEAYEGADILILNVVRRVPHSSGNVLHLTLEQAEKVIEHVRPRKAILTHFGMTMVKAKPWELADKMAQKTGIEVKAASDGMMMELDEEQD
ncbi:MAG: MBL fold metallo-hydrolase [Planctomycetes bacterium]|nr:MBL fold metallo-hydrolase [Planctomycetota bacterium]